MPYTSSYTFSGSTVISASNVQSNLTDMKEYVNGGISSSDLKTSDKWVESGHLMQGNYNPINNTMNLLSGVSGSNIAADGLESWMIDTPTARDDPSSPVNVSFPDTGSTFYLEKKADVLVRFYASATSAFDGTASGVTRAYLAFDSTKIASTYMACRPSIDTSFSPDEGDAKDANWFQWSNFFLKEDADVGWHHVRLVGYTTARQAILLNWSMTIEAYYQ